MTIIKVSKNKLHVLMIDGYVAPEDILKGAVIKLSSIMNRPISYVRGDMGHYFYKKRQFSKNLNILFFSRLVSKFRTIYCPYKIVKKEESGTTSIVKPCFYEFFSIRPNQNSLETFLTQGPQYEKNGIEHILPILQIEFENDRKFGKLGYIQNIIFINKCNNVNECCMNWVKELSFKIKDNKDYKNYCSFNQSWIDFLTHELDNYLKIPLQYRPEWSRS
jgi:hypothetical protein